MHCLRVVDGGFLRCLRVVDDGILRRVAGIVVSRPIVMEPAVVAVAWRPIPAVPVGAIVIVDVAVIVAVVVIVRVGIIG